MSLTRIVTLVAGFVLAFAALVACGSDSSYPPETSSSAEPSAAAAFPKSATFTASLPGKEGTPAVALAIIVEGDKVLAYACNGVDDSAWFRGTQKDGSMNLTSDYLDTLMTTFDGTNLDATLTLNDITYTGTAAPAPPPAGIFTATEGNARGSWVVLPDQTIVGVVQPNSKNDREVIDSINKQQQNFKDQVRQARINRQVQQTQSLSYGTWNTSLNGRSVTAVPVNASMSSLPTTN